MDKKELLKRWALAYTEPSLFYIPWKEYNSDDEYFTVTLIPHVNYYDVFDEKVIKNATLYDIYSKGFTKEQQNVYGGLHDKIRGESNVYIAKDLNGNIVASSTTHDYMSVAKKQAEETLLGYTVEYYDTDIFASYNTQRYIIKNISHIDDIEELKNQVQNRWNTLFILQTGEIYAYTSALKCVGRYDYKIDKFHFTDKNYYMSHMIISCSQVGSYSTENKSHHPILRLKKGTYIIEQLISSNSCDIMVPMKISVSENMTIDYKTKLNGFILRAFLEQSTEPSFIWSERSGTGYPILKEMSVGTFGTFVSTVKTYDISNYSLQVEQSVKTAGSSISASTEDGQSYITYGSNSIWAVLTHGYYGYDYFSNNLILYPIPLLEETILKGAPCDMGTVVGLTSMNYYSNVFLYFNLYKFHPSTPFDSNQLPSISEVEKIIVSKTPEEWLSVGFQDINEYYGVEYNRRSQFSERLYYTKDGAQGTCLDDVIFADEKSNINLVSNYFKSETVNIEDYKNYERVSTCFYVKDDGKRFYKNYSNYLSGETKYADGWNDTKISEITSQMRDILFNNQ